MTEIRYKILDGKKSKCGNHSWRKKKWYKIEGELELCENGFHCSRHIQDALAYIKGNTLAIVEVRGKSIDAEDKEAWEEMRVIATYPLTETHAIRMAIYSARMCLAIYEGAYPDDDRPRKAIEAAEAYIVDPTDAPRSAALSAMESAQSAMESAQSAMESALSAVAWSARSAAWSARSAAWSAQSAVWSAQSAMESALSAVWSAQSAAWSAADSAIGDIKTKIHEYILSMVEGEKP